MFTKSSSEGWRALVFIALSLVLFFCDYRFQCFGTLRSKLSFVAVPIQYVVNWPLDFTHSISDNFKSKQTVLQENTRLSQELLLTSTKLQRLDFLEHENSELRSLLHSSQQIKGKVLPAEIIISEVDNFGQKVTINIGKQQEVYAGQPVLDAYGLLGQVISVKSQLSKVLLITNNKSAVPVIVTRNGLQTIALGMGSSDYLELANISETADIKVGDVLVTSGIERLFPAGYQVGVVKEIKRMIGERFMKVLIVPRAHINRGSHVLLVWPNLPEKAKNIGSRKL